MNITKHERRKEQILKTVSLLKQYSNTLSGQIEEFCDTEFMLDFNNHDFLRLCEKLLYSISADIENDLEWIDFRRNPIEYEGRDE